MSAFQDRFLDLKYTFGDYEHTESKWHQGGDINSPKKNVSNYMKMDPELNAKDHHH